MKNIFYFLLACGFLITTSCEKDIQDLVTENAVEGGLIDVNTGLINYVIGDDIDYPVSLKVYQGEAKTTKINVYKSFTSGATSSNRILHTTLNVANTATAIENFTVNFGQLIDGLSVNGQALSNVDTDYIIGDFWELEFESETSSGGKALNGATAKIAISTRLAGTYKIATGIYVHPSTAPDPASLYAGAYLRIIESVDAITYKMTDIGPWSGEPDNFFYFQVDPENNIIIPKEWNGVTQIIWGADELATCPANPMELPNVSCVNKVELMDDGKDVINISYGYIRDSGTRQFDDILVKQ